MILLTISSCAQQEQTHEHDITLSGIWEYHSVYFDPAINDYVDSHVHVKITDEGNLIQLDHCLHDKSMTFTRDANLLTNAIGQSMEIIHEDKIATVNIPQLSHLVKTHDTHDLKNAGSVTIQSNKLPEIRLAESVCAQRPQQLNEETIILHLSLPFASTFIDMTLEVTTDENTENNLRSATFYSPNFTTYYGLNEINAMSGQVIFLELNDSHAKFEFDIELQGQYTGFATDRFTGSADVML